MPRVPRPGLKVGFVLLGWATPVHAERRVFHAATLGTAADFCRCLDAVAAAMPTSCGVLVWGGGPRARAAFRYLDVLVCALWCREVRESTQPQRAGCEGADRGGSHLGGGPPTQHVPSSASCTLGEVREVPVRLLGAVKS